MELTTLTNGTVDRAQKLELAALADARGVGDDPEIVALLDHGTAPKIKQMVAVLRDTERTADPVAAELARIAANADPATTAALDAIPVSWIDAETGEVLPEGREDVRITRGGDYSPEQSGHRCRKGFARTVNGRHEVVWLACKLRSCPQCGQKWQDNHLAELMAATSPDDIDADPRLVVAEVRDADWQTVRRRLSRRGANSMTVPLPDGRRLVVTDDESLGAPRSYAEAITITEQALDDMRGRAKTDKRRVSMSGGWKDAAKEHRPAPPDEDTDDVVEWKGILTNARDAAQVSEVVQRFGGKLAPVGPLDADPDDARRWRITGIPEDQMWKVWAKLGLRTFDDLALARLDRQIELDTRRWHQDRQAKARRRLEVAA